ncbi:MAG TPA: hypothetical protein VME46_05115 [Acidimicrobiales bacterium]|nr:hypothetical protein [Acidimicrobiales bacterium]
MTRRAELEAGHARRAAVGPAASTRATGPLGPEATGTAGVANPAELYLLAADRPTGQPPPPEAGTGSPGPARPTERPGRMAVGLSGA